VFPDIATVRTSFKSRSTERKQALGLWAEYLGSLRPSEALRAHRSLGGVVAKEGVQVSQPN